MKKFYSLAVAALVAVSSVSAQGLKQLSNGGFEKFGKVAATEKLAQDAPKQSIKSIGTKDIDISDISGDYAWSYTGMTQSSNGQTQTVALTITKVAGNNYTISCQGFEFGASFSLLSQTLTIQPNQDLGYNEANQIQVYLYHMSLGSDGKLSVLNTPLTASIDGDSFVFGEQDIIGIGNFEAGGYFILGYQNVFAVSEGVVWENTTMPADGWVEYGTGEFTDPWQVAGYGVDINEYAWTVNIEQNENYPGLYRMVNPYQDSPISNFNTDPTGEGYILFSIADPEFVTVYPLVYTGLRDEVGAYLNTNPEGYFTILSNGQLTKEQIISELGITPSSFDDATGIVTFRNSRFGTVAEPDQLFNWKTKEGTDILVDGYLQFNDWAGINGVSVDNENAPVEYYNLQGMRINNVENNPGLYIRKQGDKATKVFVK